MGADSGFDREAAERVIARAIDLDDVATSNPAEDHLVTSALVAAAEELGLDPELVRRAGAEEQLGLLGRRSATLDRLVGPSELVAQATMSGSVDDVLGALDGWMTRKAGVRRVSLDLHAAMAHYERRTDALAGAQRAVRSVAGRAQLGTLKRLELRVAALDDQRCLVVAVGDVGTERTATVAGASGVAVGGAAASAGAALAEVAPLWVGVVGVPASVALGAGILAMRGGVVFDLQRRLDAALGRAVETSTAPQTRLPTVRDLRGVRRSISSAGRGSDSPESSSDARGRR